jgi:hypothetical protein
MTITSLGYTDRFLISHVGGNVLDGAYWGFCSKQDYNKWQRETEGEPLQQIRGYLLKGGSGVLIQVDPHYMFGLLKQIQGLDLTDDDIEGANTLNLQGALAFKSFINDAKGYQGFIGVNEISDAINVSISQKLYPSFKADIQLVMHEFSRVDVEYLNENNVWVKYNKNVSVVDFAKSFTMSPTRNCMVLPIRLK